MTVEDGHQALLFNNHGQGQLVIGPRRVSVRLTRVELYGRGTMGH